MKGNRTLNAVDYLGGDLPDDDVKGLDVSPPDYISAQIQVYVHLKCFDFPSWSVTQTLLLMSVASQHQGLKYL